jgi:2-phospho-L-lactate transferase/gluconeogenesis factor (CofD/UPF0052 family)
LPRWLRVLLLVATGGATTFIGWERLSHALMRLMAPEQDEGQFVDLVRARTRAQRGRRVVVVGGTPGVTPVLTALQQVPDDLRVDVILPATAPGRVVQELQQQFGFSSNQIIYPTEADAVLYAELESGELLEGVTAINYASQGRIKDLFLSRDIRRVQVWEADRNGHSRSLSLKGYMPNVTERALETIAQAELIIFAPGHMFTQVLPNLTQPRFAQAIRESRAPKVFVMNLMTEPGRTDGWSVAEHLDAIRELTGVSMDYAIVHAGTISATMRQQYENEGSRPVAFKDLSEHQVSELIFADTGQSTTLLNDTIIVRDDLVTEAPQMVTFQRNGDTVTREMPVVRHDPGKLATLVAKLLSDKL